MVEVTKTKTKTVSELRKAVRAQVARELRARAKRSFRSAASALAQIAESDAQHLASVKIRALRPYYEAIEIERIIIDLEHGRSVE